MFTHSMIVYGASLCNMCDFVNLELFHFLNSFLLVFLLVMLNVNFFFLHNNFRAKIDLRLVLDVRYMTDNITDQFALCSPLTDNEITREYVMVLWWS